MTGHSLTCAESAEHILATHWTTFSKPRFSAALDRGGGGGSGVGPPTLPGRKLNQNPGGGGRGHDAIEDCCLKLPAPICFSAVTPVFPIKPLLWQRPLAKNATAADQLPSGLPGSYLEQDVFGAVRQQRDSALLHNEGALIVHVLIGGRSTHFFFCGGFPVLGR